MGAKDVKAGGASVTIGADDSSLSRVLSGAEKRLKAFGKAATDIGQKGMMWGSAFVGGALLMAKSFADSGSALDDMSQRTGDSVANLSAMGHAAKMSGSSLEELEGGYSKMAGTVAGAIAGEKTATKLLTDLGLKADDLKGKLPTEQFDIFADKLSQISDNSTKVDMVKSVFGKSGTQLIPLLNEGSAGIGRLREEAKKLGLVMSDDDASAAAKFGDSLDTLYSAAGSVKNQIGAALAPALTDIAAMLTNAVGQVANFIKENKGLVIGTVAAAAALVAGSAALYAVGIAAGVAAMAVKLLGLTIAVLTSPVTLVVAAIAGATYAFLRFTDVGQALAARIGKAFGGMFTMVKAVFGGIANALKAGDIKLAGEILMTSLRIAWTQGLDHLSDAWEKFRINAVGVFDLLGTNLKAIWDIVIAYMEGALDQSLQRIVGSVKTMAGLVGQIDKKTGNAMAALGAGLTAGVNAGAADREAKRNARIADAGGEADRQKRADERQAQLNALGGANPQLAALQAQLAALLVQAAEKAQPNAATVEAGKAGAEAAAGVGLSMSSSAAQARGSSGAAGSIAKAYNAQGNTAQQTLTEIRKVAKGQAETNKHLSAIEKWDSMRMIIRK